MTGWKVLTYADIMAEDTEEHKNIRAQIEKSFRRGYFYAISDTIDNMKNGVSLRQLEAYFNNDIWRWYFGESPFQIIKPPRFPEMWKTIRTRILERDEYTCHYCGGKADSVDHKTPIVLGGSDDDENLVACCRKCNSKKRITPYEEYIYSLEAS